MMMKSHYREERSTSRRRRIRVQQLGDPPRQQRQQQQRLSIPLLLSPLSLLLLLIMSCLFYFSSSSLLCSAWVVPLTAKISPQRRLSSIKRRSSSAAASPCISVAASLARKGNSVQLEMAAAAESDGDGDSQMKEAITNRAKVKRKRAARLTSAEGSSEGSSRSSAVDSSSSSSLGDDETEWKSIMAAFALYKAAYGNLKVPQRFIVPNMRPWPKPAWGLRLGRVVSNIRATGKYLQNKPHRKQQLDELGFLWQVRGTTATGSKSGVTLEQVYTALCLYREIYAHTQVPINFVVPDVAPWPESVRQLPLGRHVASLPKVLENPANAKWALQFNKLDLLSKAAAASASASSSATAASVDSSGDSDAEGKTDLLSAATPAVAPPKPPPLPTSPPPLPVPNTRTAAVDMSPGATPRSSSLSSSTDITSSPPSDEESLAELQAEAAAVDLRFERVLAALKTYKAMFGDLLVPQPFCVPERSSEWPRETWGLRLGARVNAIRSQGTFVNNNPQRRQMLDDIEFVWSPPRTERRGRRKASEIATSASTTTPPPTSAAAAATRYSSSDMDKSGDDDDDDVALLFDETFGNFKEFSLDDEDGSPTWGLQAGRDALQEKALRQQQEAAKKEEDYYEFVSPQSLQESLKEATERAIEVGVIEGMTENNRVIKGKRQKDIPWFNDDFGQDFVFEDVVEALTLYKEFYGDFGNLTESITPDFVVPTPEERTGFMDDDDDDDDMDLDALETFNVGASARAARAIAKFEREGDLEKSGDLITSEIERLQQELMAEKEPFSARALQSEMWPVTETLKRTSAVSAEWPEHLAGMALGSIVNRIRDGSLEVRHIPERKAILDKLGFDWGEDVRFIDVPFEKAMCAMYAYYLVRGDMFVYEDFVMPDEDPWPQALAGYEIGKAVKRLRELQHFLEAYHPEKVSLLRMIDFVWFPTTALSLDPDEPEMDTELLMLSAMGHPDYAKMIDIPMGLPDRIIADGPFFDSADPKNWWRKWHNWDYVKDYWYQQGRRDNAFVLRGMGYPRMAAEHEARYGPGLFAQMEETLQEIEAGVEGKSIEEKKEILAKLSYYRQEMLGCTDIHAQDVEKTLEDLDAHMLTIIKDANLDYPIDEKEVDDELEEEEDEYEEVVEEDEGEDDEYEYYEEEEFELEDELGLDKSREKKP